jgi:hypothetical protein
MDEVLYDKWLTALESGEYLKGKGKLKEKIGGSYHYCCLGVLADIRGTLKRENGLFFDTEQRSYYFIGSIVDSVIQDKLSRINDNSETFDRVIEYIKDNKEFIFGQRKIENTIFKY